MIVQAQCRDIPVNLLVDTGASISLVNSRFVEIAHLSQSVRSTKTVIAGLSKKVIPVHGEITLPILLGNCETNHVFIVCDKLDNEFLIGMDLLHKIEANIDLRRNKLTTRNGEVDFINKPVKLDKTLKIRCQKNVTIPANTAGFIWGKIPVKSTKLNYEGVVDPYRKLAANQGVFITGSISYSRMNSIPIHYMNVMPEDVTIYRNQLIGFFEPLENDTSINGVQRLNNYDANFDLPRLDDAKTIEETISEGKWDNPDELLRKLRIDEIDLPQNFKNKLKNLLTEFSHCFARDRFDLGKASFYKAKINLKTDWQAKLVPSRSVPYKLESHMDEEIDNMIKA